MTQPGLLNIPNYTIKKKLGEGGMAEVYLAIHTNLSRMVAIKIMNPKIFKDRRLAKRFFKEASALSRLNHPNIVTIFEVGRVKHYLYIVMEYLQESLKELIRDQKFFQPEKAFHIALPIADALFFAHKKGIVHRDIKPENILFNKDGLPVLVDFGIAKEMDSTTKLTLTGMSVGTPPYMSPEQCMALKVDGRSDIYSLGAVLYEMLTGKVPYKGKDTLDVVMKHLKEPVPRLPSELKNCQPIIDKMMAKKKRDRIQSMKELNGIVNKLLSFNPPQSRDVTNLKDAGKSTMSKTNPTVTMNGQDNMDKVHDMSDLNTLITINKAKTKDKKKLRKLRWLAFALFIILVAFVWFQQDLFKQLIRTIATIMKAISDFLF